MRLFIAFLLLFTTFYNVLSYADIPLTTANITNVRFITYLVNPPEGFNLRRDVYVRVASLIRRLVDSGQDWVLVLPPWPHLYHWRSSYQNGLSWSQFFDISSLSHFIPVIDYPDYEQRFGPVTVDRVWHLETPDFTVEGYSFETEFSQIPCNESSMLYTHSAATDTYHDPMLEEMFGNILIQSVECYRVMGSTDAVESVLSSVQAGELILIDHFEVLMHYDFGGRLYWAARASMVYAEHLRAIANQFMQKHMSFSPETETEVTADYLSVHLRRGDYLYARPNEIPSLDGAVQQIAHKLNMLNLSLVFLSTDSSREEVEYIKSKLGYRVVRFEPTSDQLSAIGDGGVSIVDQWIAGHARYFIGSAESTFSFRICEDRQLERIPEDLTYNCLCSDAEPDCRQPTRWKVVF